MRAKLLILMFFAAVCLLGGVFVFLWAVNNFLSGLTLEALALSVILVVMGVGFASAARNNRQHMR